jgi:DNA-binding MarR family transcriptional regulator
VPRTTVTEGGPADQVPAPAEAVAADIALAEGLLTTMASIRRRLRRRPGRPVLLATLTGSQLELVRLVRRQPGVSVADAADELRLAPNTVSTLVTQLVEAGHLRRRPDPDDRRVARLELSPATRRKVESWRDRRALALSRAMVSLPVAERRQVAAALPALARLDEALYLMAPDEEG